MIDMNAMIASNILALLKNQNKKQTDLAEALKKKYALLDTDFISKTHLIRKDDQNKMIDRIMEMPGYRFYCHEQIRTELTRHNIGNSTEWLETKISDESVHCISDEEIIDELHTIYSVLLRQCMQTCSEMDAKHIKMAILKRTLHDYKHWIICRYPGNLFFRD